MESVDNIISERELDEFINKCGSLVSLALNKSISSVTLFSQLMEDEELKDVLLDINDYSWYDMVIRMTYRYPILHKSKKIKKLT